MKQHRKNSELPPSAIISAIIFALLLIGLVVFAVFHDSDTEYSNTFFDNVSDFMR